jgi:hypothetical protein
MPNHISTNLEVTGTPKVIDEFIKRAAYKYENGETAIFTFGSFHPCPKELHEVSSPVRIVSQEEYDKFKAELEIKIAALKAEGKDPDYFIGNPITEEMRQTYLAHLGADNWYDWQVANWGTKWDCYGHSNEWTRTTNPNDDTQETIKCFYMTAWSPATAALTTISAMYPTLTFKHSYADEGGGFIGYEVIQDGKVIEEVEYNWESVEAKRLRAELGMSDYNEEE